MSALGIGYMPGKDLEVLVAQWRASIDVPATIDGPAAARRVIAALLPVWELPALRDSAELVVSELVTNAYLHAPGSDSFELEIVRRENGVRIGLADGNSIRPMLRELGGEEPSGRGMSLVAALASAWGAEDHHGGKRVWVVLDLEFDEGDAR
jgi:anti-sigma regulatory factor (Ser/Thr protein kinase)